MAKSIYDFKVKTRKGEDLDLATLKGKVLLIVNTATGCGFTPQYEGIENLYKEYHEKGLEVLDFPCNQFGHQAPGTEEEIHDLLRHVLAAKGQGQSVRASVMDLSHGDKTLMLRYQNKYRAVIKSRPDYVQDIVEKLKSQGVECETPQVNHRARADLQQSGEALVSEARRTGDGELARACDVLTQYLQGRRAVPADDGVAEAARELIGPIKEFVALDTGARMEAAEAFCDDIARRIGTLEAKLDEARE